MTYGVVVAHAEPAHDRHLRRAVELAGVSAVSGGGPFGAVVVLAGETVGEGTNDVVTAHDPTAHAEVQAIRTACARVGSHDLPGAIVYASCEPCPMCLGAIYWARTAELFFAATRDEAARAGFSDALIYDEVGLSPAARSVPGRHVEVPGARDVFRTWAAQPDHTPY